MIEELKEVPPSDECWKEQLKNVITTREELGNYIELLEEEKQFFESNDEQKNYLKFQVTPYYLNVIKKDKTNALRKTIIPTVEELTETNDVLDSLGEDKQSPCKNLVHRYPNRILFLTTDMCFSNCRFCSRSRIINKRYNEDLFEAFDYIRNHKEIEDVIISGGDPLTMSSLKIYNILEELYSIDHIKIIRIGTKAPVVLPQRFDSVLLQLLDKFSKKLYMNIHFTHPIEITKEVEDVCWKLNRLGIPLGSQTVLLKGVNDNIETMKELMQKLVAIKVKPYYLYLADNVKNSVRFKTTIDKGNEIIHSIQGHLSGLSVPRFIVDSEFGKLPVDGAHIEGWNKKYFHFKNYKNEKIIIEQ